VELCHASRNVEEKRREEKRREEKRREENSSQLFSWGLHRGFNFIFGAFAATQMNGLWVRSANERNTKEHSKET
jgi:hypothetical protein